MLKLVVHKVSLGFKRLKQNFTTRVTHYIVNLHFALLSSSPAFLAKHWLAF